jgi:hypothetical protein
MSLTRHGNFLNGTLLRPVCQALFETLHAAANMFGADRPSCIAAASLTSVSVVSADMYVLMPPVADAPSAPEIVALLPQLSALVAAASEWAKSQEGQTKDPAPQKHKPRSNGTMAHSAEWVQASLASLQADLVQVGVGRKGS